MSSTRTCSSCGQTSPAIARFCEHCGNPLTSPTIPASGSPTPPPPPPPSLTPLAPQNPFIHTNIPSSPDSLYSTNDQLQSPTAFSASPIAIAQDARPDRRRQRKPRSGCGGIGCFGCLTTVLILVLLFVVIGSLAAAAGAEHNGSITLHDDAGVLDAQKIKAYNDNLIFNVIIYTTNDFSSASLSSLTSDARSKAERNESLLDRFDTVVIEIDTTHQQGTVASRKSKDCSSSKCRYYEKSQDTAGRYAFIGSYSDKHDYTEATLATLRSLTKTSNQQDSTRVYGRFVRDRVVTWLGPEKAASLFDMAKFTTIAFWAIVIIGGLLLSGWARRVVRRFKEY